MSFAQYFGWRLPTWEEWNNFSVNDSIQIDINKVNINLIQLEKIIHGAKLKSYNFNIYKSIENKNKNKNINLNIIG